LIVPSAVDSEEGEISRLDTSGLIYWTGVHLLVPWFAKEDARRSAWNRLFFARFCAARTAVLAAVIALEKKTGV